MIHLPKVKIKYWFLMILATTIGEIVGNLISRNLGLGYSTGSILLISIFVLSLITAVIAKTEAAKYERILMPLQELSQNECRR